MSQHKLPLRGAPLIMGHENVGYLAKVGRDFERLKGFKEGDLVFLEHYLPCGHCEWDHMGEYRHCAATEWFYDPTAIRYGATPIDIEPSLWGGFSHYIYLPLNAVLHRVPRGLTPEEAGVATPMSNGVQWTLVRRRRRLRFIGAHSGPWSAGHVLRDGRQAGRRLSHHRDRHLARCAATRGRDRRWARTRSSTCRKRMRLRASCEITEGRGVDVVVDCSSGAGTAPVLLGIEATKRRGGTMVVQGKATPSSLISRSAGSRGKG